MVNATAPAASPHPPCFVKSGASNTGVLLIIYFASATCMIATLKNTKNKLDSIHETTFVFYDCRHWATKHPKGFEE